MERLLIALLLAVVAGAVAVLLQRRRPRAALGAPEWGVPTHLQRADFERPEAAWLVVAFTSVTCDSCAAVWERVQLLEAPEVAVQNVEARARRDLHQRYRIDAVPLVAVVDGDGAVRAHFLGSTPAADLWGTLAGLRAESPPLP